MKAESSQLLFSTYSVETFIETSNSCIPNLIQADAFQKAKIRSK